MASLVLHRFLRQSVLLRHHDVVTLSCAGIKVYEEPKPRKSVEPNQEKEAAIYLWRQFPIQLKQFMSEWKDKFKGKEFDMANECRQHGDYRVPYTFNSKEDIAQWTVTSDLDNTEGKSYATFTLGPHKTGLFRGFIDAQTKNRDVAKTTGYANIQAHSPLKSFGRAKSMDWTGWEHVVIRYRGDGRRYLFNAHCDKYWDQHWHDVYSYPLYTRGGPYWQVEKIPFSKLILSSEGRIQDDQEFGILIHHMHNISRLGFTCGDTVTGPFQLEIDYIALMKDHNHTEIEAYEKYAVPKSYLF